MKPYVERAVRFLGVWEVDGWRLKMYGISAVSNRPPDALVTEAKRIARDRLPSPPVTNDRYGIGVLIVHEGADGQYVLVDWWTGENMLQHHLYAAAPGAVAGFEYISPTGLCVCVWELEVLYFERRGWIDAVLSNPGGPDFDRYLSLGFEGCV